MKINIDRFLSLLITIAYLSTQTGCATVPKSARPYPKNQSFSEARFDPGYTYRIEMKDNKATYKVDGAQLESRNNNLVIKLAQGESVIPGDQIEKIAGTSNKRKGSYAWPGFGIGAGVGALTLGLGFAFGGKCTGTSDSSDCDNLKVVAPVLGGLAGGVIGGLIGLGIGYAIPKKSKVTIVPTVSQSGSETRAGVGLSLPF